MTFGADLQQVTSHRALVQLQDAEIQLLELLKKCLHQRVKSDRDYANALSVIINYAQKFETPVNSPLFQVWNTVVKETEGFIALLRDHANRMSSRALERLVHIIAEKRTAKKFYIEEKTRIDNEFQKVKDEVFKLRQEYEKSVSKQIQERLKYEDLATKGTLGKKLEDAKGKVVKASAKLHKVHNEYVAAVREARLHQENYRTTTLPGILDYQEEVQKYLVSQCKSVLIEYSELSDLSTPEHTAHFSAICTAINSVSADEEYHSFVEENRSQSLPPVEFEFDNDLLNGYKGTLKANELAVNNLSIEYINCSHFKIKEQFTDCSNKLTTKKTLMTTQKEQMDRLQKGSEPMDDMQQNSYNIHKRAVLDLEREIQELQCKQTILEDLNALYDMQLTAVSDGDLPDGVDFSDTNVFPSVRNYDRNESSGSSSLPEPLPPRNHGNIANNIQGKVTNLISRMRKPSSGGSPAPPRPPVKDFKDEGSYIDTNLQPNRASVMSDGEGSNKGVMGSSNDNNVTHSASFTDGYQQMIPNPNRKLDEEEWFHGVLPREEVQRLLTTDGDYLVRESKNRKTGEVQYVLSVFWNDHKHFIIQGCDNNWRFEGEQYNTVQELVISQHNSGVPVTRKSGAILTKPIKRETWELRNDDIILGQKIGNGNFGDVFKGVYKLDNGEVAVKTCRETLSEDAKKKFLQEGRILKQYDHENIVRFIGIAAQRHPVMIVMEFVAGGALLTYLKKHGAQQTKRQLVRMCSDASGGMDYLESRNCIHRDLAARNCLVGKNNRVKISDFGMSREEEEYTVSGGMKQIPIKWTAPEALNYGTYTSACDIWSFGVLMWEVFSFGQSPYPGLTNTQARERVDDGYRMPMPDGMPPSVYDLQLKAWEQEPKNRPHFDEIHKELERIYKTLPYR